MNEITKYLFDSIDIEIYAPSTAAPDRAVRQARRKIINHLRKNIGEIIGDSEMPEGWEICLDGKRLIYFAGGK